MKLPSEDALKRTGNADKYVGQPFLAGCSSCATPVAYGGKPHNSLFQIRFGDKPCRTAQESHDFNRGRCQPPDGYNPKLRRFCPSQQGPYAKRSQNSTYCSQNPAAACPLAHDFPQERLVQNGPSRTRHKFTLLQSQALRGAFLPGSAGIRRRAAPETDILQSDSSRHLLSGA